MTGETPRRRRPRAFVALGVVVGIAAVSGALFALLRTGDEPEPASEWRHTWDAELAGQVWITVDAEDAATRRITLTWGPWQRQILHASADPVTYWTTKTPSPEGEDAVPIMVDVNPGAVITFGEGTPPVPAEDVSQEWTRAPNAGED
ncbi:MAG: hypothetical protein ACRD2C_25255 [Acidimicrobiales bacterium]